MDPIVTALSSIDTSSIDSETLAQQALRLLRSWSLTNILSALATLAVCVVSIKLFMRLLKRLLSHTSLGTRPQSYIVSGIRILLYVLTGVIVAQGLGIDTTSLVALLSVFSLGVALAAEEALGNFAGTLVLLSSRPFLVGDVIESSSDIGTVQEIGLHYTKLLNIDGQYILIPNKDLAASRIKNYTALGRRRVTVTINAAYDASTEAVKAACYDAVSMTEGILPDPAPAVRLTEYGPNSIGYSVFCWVRPSDYLGVMYALNDHLRDAFARGGVEMTYDHMNVHIVENRGVTPPPIAPGR